MIDKSKPESLSDTDLDDVHGGLFSTHGAGAELTVGPKDKGYYDGAGNHIVGKTARKGIIGKTEKNVIAEGGGSDI